MLLNLGIACMLPGVSAWADGAVPQNHSGQLDGCFPVGDTRTGTYSEFCDSFTASADHTLSTLTIDGRIYDLGDRVTATLEQDLSDDIIAVQAEFTIRDGTAGQNLVEEFAMNITESMPGLGKAVLVITLDEKYQAGLCYDISGSFVSQRPFSERAMDGAQFCIAEPDAASVTSRITALETSVLTLTNMLNSLKVTVEALADRVGQIAMSIGSAPPSGPDPLLSGTVYHDSNGNGMMDDGERKIANATVLTVDMSDFSKVVRVTTDGSGMYRFADLKPGSYLVQVEGLAGPHAFSYLVISSVTIQDLGVA